MQRGEGFDRRSTAGVRFVNVFSPSAFVHAGDCRDGHRLRRSGFFDGVGKGLRPGRLYQLPRSRRLRWISSL